VITYSATYSPEDNKLRLSASSRLPADTYKRVSEAGFIWAPKQEIFVAGRWTPDREDLLRELCGEIDDEESTLEERAAARAERFEVYSEKRGNEAESARAHVHTIAQRFEFGQPILVGHHSEKRARRDAEKIDTGMRRAVRLHETARYWERRAARVQRHASYKADPGARERRIKKLEAEQRSHKRDLAAVRARAEQWAKVAAIADADEQLAAALEITRIRDAYSTRDALASGKLSSAEACEKALASCARYETLANRWIDHLAGRLAYERVLLGRAPDEETKVDRRRRGACALPLLNYQAERIETRCRFRDETESLRQVAMTAAEYKKIDDDRKGGHVSADGTHRVRTTILHTKGGGFGGEFVAVFISDSKVHPVPVPKPKPPEPTAEEVEAEIAAEEAIAEEAQEQETVEADETPAAGAAPEPPAPDPFEKMRAALKAGGVKTIAVPQLFETPAPLAVRVVESAGVEPGDLVLEPEGGLGALALAARARGANVRCVEINVAAAEHLRSLGFEVRTADFLELRPEDFETLFDRVVMNPPFAKRADIRHVRHAFTMLRPGGTLAAVMSAGTLNQNQEATRFRSFVEANGGTITKLPEGSFAESGTGTATVLVTMKRPLSLPVSLPDRLPSALHLVADGRLA